MRYLSLSKTRLAMFSYPVAKLPAALILTTEDTESTEMIIEEHDVIRVSSALIRG
jgi:hypothetical protein